MSESSGFLNINKPLHMTSHDVVAKIRRTLKVQKVGHAGTLDPLATGVLIICVGNATRLSDYVMHATKRYLARICLGVTTDTYDAEGAILQECDISHLQQIDIEEKLDLFQGGISQMPPMYSAIKQGGRKLYDLARAGQTVEREMRPVRIDSLRIVNWMPPEFVLEVTCSAGTYIRSLAHDLGEALGVGAHLSGLSRIASGTFQLANAISLDQLFSAEHWQQYLIEPRSALADWPVVHLTVDDADHIVHGRPIVASNPISELALAYNPQEQLIAVLRSDAGLWRPHKVFSD